MIEGDAGVTVTETSCAAVTVSVVDAARLVAGSSAVIVVSPTAPPVAMPSDPAAFEIEAIAGVEEDHVTLAVSGWVEASVYVPVAVN